jgi:hypothetical protein
MFEDTRMSSIGSVILCSISQATAEQWGSRQQDWVLVSQRHKRIAIVDLCRQSGASCPWRIHVFPWVLHWVVGICGIIDPSHVHSLLKFLEISIMHPQTAVERTVLSSVRRSFSSTQCALEDSPKLCDLTWIHTAAQRTVMMKKVGSGSSGTRTGALLVHLKTALTRIPRTQTA